MLQRGIIISIQPTPGSVFDSVPHIVDFAKASEAAGAIAVKIEGLRRIEAVKNYISIPVIGISKIAPQENGRFPITPTKELLDLIFVAGADFAATESLAVIEAEKGHIRSRIIFEADAFETAKIAESFGVAAIATTLFGYTPETSDRFSPDPDIEAVELLAQHLSTPIIAEGRFSKQEDISKAVRLGAHCVCIGTAVSRPDIIIAQYVKGFELEAPVYRG